MLGMDVSKQTLKAQEEARAFIENTFNEADFDGSGDLDMLEAMHALRPGEDAGDTAEGAEPAGPDQGRHLLPDTAHRHRRTWCFGRGGVLVRADAFYFTIISVSTVGLGDLTPSEGGGKVFWYVFMILTLGLMASIIQTLGSLLGSISARENIADPGDGKRDNDASVRSGRRSREEVRVDMEGDTPGVRPEVVREPNLRRFAAGVYYYRECRDYYIEVGAGYLRHLLRADRLAVPPGAGLPKRTRAETSRRGRGPSRRTPARPAPRRQTPTSRGHRTTVTGRASNRRARCAKQEPPPPAARGTRAGAHHRPSAAPLRGRRCRRRTEQTAAARRGSRCRRRTEQTAAARRGRSRARRRRTTAARRRRLGCSRRRPPAAGWDARAHDPARRRGDEEPPRLHVAADLYGRDVVAAPRGQTDRLGCRRRRPAEQAAAGCRRRPRRPPPVAEADAPPNKPPPVAAGRQRGSCPREW